MGLPSSPDQNLQQPAISHLHMHQNSVEGNSDTTYRYTYTVN